MIVHFAVQEHEKKELETPGGEDLLKRFGGSSSVPFFAFLNGGGEMIVNSNGPGDANGKGKGNIGHPAKPYEVDWFMAMLAKAVPQMTGDERSTLESWLRAQKQ